MRNKPRTHAAVHLAIPMYRAKSNSPRNQENALSHTLHGTLPGEGKPCSPSRRPDKNEPPGGIVRDNAHCWLNNPMVEGGVKPPAIGGHFHRAFIYRMYLRWGLPYSMGGGYSPARGPVCTDGMLGSFLPPERVIIGIIGRNHYL